MTLMRRLVSAASTPVVLLVVLSVSSSAQNPASVSSTLAARPAALLPAPPAKAGLPAAPRPAATAAEAADPSRKWEVEFHGAGFASFNPTGGTSFLPSIVGGFSGPSGGSSLIIPSWYFGVGANLYNTVVANHPATLSQRIEPLDFVLNNPVARRDSGPGFGARLSRDLTSRFTVEAGIDYNAAHLGLYGATSKINTSAMTFQSSFTQLFSPTSCGTCTGLSVTSAATFHDHQGQQLMATGALHMNLWRHGRAIPYLLVGGGGIFSLGDTPSVDVVGNYKFTISGAPHNETDSVRLHYGVPDHAATGFFGGGVKYYLTPHYGLRMEVRDYVSGYHVDNFVDASPSVATLTPANVISTTGSPTLVFSNNPATGFPSSLSAPPLTNFRTLAGSGTLHQVEFTFGFFWRF